MIVSCGEALIDFSQSPDGRYLGSPGGSPYNVAVALARQGIPTAFLSQLSTDLFGQQLVEYLAQNGVKTTWLPRVDAPTTLAFVNTREQSEPQYAFYANGAADVTLTGGTLPDVLPARVFHFGSISLMQEPCGTTWTEYARDVQGIISFDPNIRPSLISDPPAYKDRFREMLARSTILKLSAPDLQWLFPRQDRDAVVQHLLASGPQLVIVTSGAEDTILYSQFGAFTQPSFKVDVVDTIGAGDSFMAGFLAYLYRYDLSFSNPQVLKDSLQWAAATAALNCRHAGTHPPRQDEVQSFLADHPASAS